MSSNELPPIPTLQPITVRPVSLNPDLWPPGTKFTLEADDPKGNDKLDPLQLAAALDVHAAKLTKRGDYGVATDLRDASNLIDDLWAQNAELNELLSVARKIIEDQAAVIENSR
jgi:hypothetical protein